MCREKQGQPPSSDQRTRRACLRPGLQPGAYLLQGDDEEGASSRTLGDDGQEAGVDGAEVVIVHVLGDGDPIEAVLPVSHLPVHVPELGASVLRTPGHL